MEKWQQPLIPGLHLGEGSWGGDSNGGNGDDGVAHAVPGGPGPDAASEEQTPAERTLSFIVAEVARVNGRATCREGGLPAGAEYVSDAGVIDLDTIPGDDEATIELLGSAHTLGCFASSPNGLTAPDYQSAWLKAHFPVEFLTGVLEHTPDGPQRNALLDEARRIGVPLLPIDINASGDRHRVERIGREVKGIRLPLHAVAEDGGSGVSDILDGQPFVSITDVQQRGRPSRALMTSLAAVGAFDSLLSGAETGAGPGTGAARGRGDGNAGESRRGAIIAFVRQLTARPRTRTSRDGRVPMLGEESLAEARVPDPSTPVSIAAAGRGQETVQLSGDGLAADEDTAVEAESGGRPGLEETDEEDMLDPYRPMLDQLGVTSAAQALGLRAGARVLLAGTRCAPPLEVDSQPSTGGESDLIGLDDGIACVAIEAIDESGQGEPLFVANLMLVRGRTRRTDDDDILIRAEEIVDLEDLWQTWLIAAS